MSQGPRLQSQSDGRAVPSLDNPMSLPQDTDDVFALDRIEVVNWRATQNQGAFNDIFQLADIARPAQCRQLVSLSFNCVIDRIKGPGWTLLRAIHKSWRNIIELSHRIIRAAGPRARLAIQGHGTLHVIPCATSIIRACFVVAQERAQRPFGYGQCHVGAEGLSSLSIEKRPALAMASQKKKARYSVSSKPNKVSSESTLAHTWPKRWLKYA
jgi:hypothetical protein